jgi:uncharacterized membrane protein YhdT
LKQIGLFEMRRLEALSNTIFGVAMTLLAYDLPKASRFANAPAWMELVDAYAQPVIALMISFIVAGMFWAQPSSAAHLRAGRQPRRSLPQSDLPAVDRHASGDEWTLRRVSAR